jgi:hypothetical protein
MTVLRRDPCDRRGNLATDVRGNDHLKHDASARLVRVGAFALVGADHVFDQR